MSQVTYDTRILELAAGSHTIEVTSKASGYVDSDTATATMNIFSVSASITNGTITNVPSIVYAGDGFSGVVSGNDDYNPPASLTVSGGTLSYNDSTGTYSITSATGTVSIGGSCVLKETLASPTSVAINNDTISFTTVANATSYDIYSDSTYVGTTSTSGVSIDTLSNYSDVASGAHSLTIVAKANRYKDSNPSTAVSYTKLAQVTNVSINSSMFSFTAASNATSYDIYAINTSGTSTYLGNTANTSFDIMSTTNYSQLSSGTYLIKIISRGAGTYTLSDISDGGFYIKQELTLIAPSTSLSATMLHITDNDGNATSFDVYDGDTYLGNVVKTSTTTLKDLDDYNLSGGVHYIRAKAIASGYNPSAFSYPDIRYEQYATLETPVGNILLDGYTFVISSVDTHATSYDVFADNTKIVNDKAITDSSSLRTDLEQATSSLPAGTYAITAVLKSTSVYYYDSAPSTAVSYSTIVQLNAPTISISGSDLTITQNDENAEQYGLYVNGTRQATISLPALSTPATPTASGTVITFAEVPNADSYDVYADGSLLDNYAPTPA